MNRAAGLVRVCALGMTLGGCAQVVGTVHGDAGADAMDIGWVTVDVATDASPWVRDAGTVPDGGYYCGPRRCQPDELCEHEGFVTDDGGFSECDYDCVPRADAAVLTCESVGAYYCRTLCHGIHGRDIYCECS